MRFARERGLRLNIVTAGTGENDVYLDFLEGLAAGGTLDTEGRAWLLQHLYFCEPEQARRSAALGLDVTTSMSFSWGKGELVRERLGEHLLEHFIPLRRLLDAGLRVGCGTDWGPKNVFEHIALAVEPTYSGSGARAPTPGVTREEALAMWTREAAHVLRWEGIGSLAARPPRRPLHRRSQPARVPDRGPAGHRGAHDAARRRAGVRGLAQAH